VKSLCLAAAAIAAFLGTPTSAGIAGYFKDGNDILRACTAAMGDPQFAVCNGYLEGIADVLESNVINGFRSCVPEAATSGQLKDVVNQFLRVNAARRHLAAAGLVANAFAAAFPCR
jgi:hypothetical protein